MGHFAITIPPFNLSSSVDNNKNLFQNKLSYDKKTPVTKAGRL